MAVWLAADDLSAERKLLACMGATLVREQVHTPTARQVDVAHVGKGDVLLLQQASQPVPGRRIVGVTLRTRDLALLRRALEKKGGRAAGDPDQEGPQHVPAAAAGARDVAGGARGAGIP